MTLEYDYEATLVFSPTVYLHLFMGLLLLSLDDNSDRAGTFLVTLRF